MAGTCSVEQVVLLHHDPDAHPAEPGVEMACAIASLSSSWTAMSSECWAPAEEVDDHRLRGRPAAPSSAGPTIRLDLALRENRHNGHGYMLRCRSVLNLRHPARAGCLRRRVACGTRRRPRDRSRLDPVPGRDGQCRVLRDRARPAGAAKPMDIRRRGPASAGLQPRFWLGPRPRPRDAREAHRRSSPPTGPRSTRSMRRRWCRGRVLHAPRVWPEYHSSYYGAFVRDLDGNNVEAVCHTPPEEPAAEPTAAATD